MCNLQDPGLNCNGLQGRRCVRLWVVRPALVFDGAACESAFLTSSPSISFSNHFKHSLTNHSSPNNNHSNNRNTNPNTPCTRDMFAHLKPQNRLVVVLHIYRLCLKIVLISYEFI